MRPSRGRSPQLELIVVDDGCAFREIGASGAMTSWLNSRVGAKGPVPRLTDDAVRHNRYQ